MSRDPLGVLCCRGIAPEVQVALTRIGKRDAQIACFPMNCHKATRPAAPHSKVLQRLMRECDLIVTVCLCCCEGAIIQPGDRDRIVQIMLQTQGEAFLGAEATQHALDEGAFITHPGWLRQWKSIIEEEWGFDRDTAREFFAQSSKKILLIDTGLVPILPEEIDAMGSYLDLPVERQFTGVSHLEALLDHALTTLEARQREARLTEDLKEVRAGAAGHAALVDFVTSLGRVLSEQEIVQTLHQLAETLFGAARVSYQSHDSDRSFDEEPPQGEPDFVVPVKYADAELGELRVYELALPEFIDRYRSLAQGLADASAIAIKAARLFDREKRLSEELAGKVRELDSFASVTAHDLKQPLSAAIGFADLLRVSTKGALSEKQSGFLDHVTGALNRMDQLIQEILVLTRVGRQDVEAEVIDMNELSDEVVGELKSALDERGCVLVRNELPKVLGAKRWVHEILSNLLTNAIKYNDKDKPHIEVGVTSNNGRRSRKTRMASLFVRDNGLGIAPEDQARVFEMFCRLDSPVGAEGTGIGLAIVRKAIEGEGGRIWLESTPGQGSTFHFTLPLA